MCAVRCVLFFFFGGVRRVIAAQLFRTFEFRTLWRQAGVREKKNDEIDFFETAVRDRQGRFVR